MILMGSDYDTEPPMKVMMEQRDKALVKQVSKGIEEVLQGYRGDINRLESSNAHYYKECERLKRDIQELKDKLKELAV